MKCNMVANCACIGVPDKLRGEVVKVFIVPAKDASRRAIKKELDKTYKKYLAKYEIPRIIDFIDEMPKTKLGKVDIKALQNN